MLWLWLICIIFLVILVILLLKIRLLQKAAEEIGRELAYSLGHETNNLITISSRDKYMRSLAVQLNTDLRLLRRERHRFRQGDLEMKEVIANISHDLRTPLTAICGYLELLKGEDKSETAERYLEIIDERAKSLKELMEELFDYTVIVSSRGENLPEQASSGKISREIDFQEISLNSVLEESISAYYAALVGCKITPCISIPEEKVIRRLDKRALSRIFENILSNAIKYSDGDLRITLTGDGTIRFDNHASGLDEVQVSRLFNRFFTVETAQSATGLGLSIARSLTEQLSGEIDAFYRESVLSIQIRFPE